MWASSIFGAIKDQLRLNFQMWMSSASRDLESRSVFETILTNIANFLKSKAVAEADKEMVSTILEGWHLFVAIRKKSKIRTVAGIGLNRGIVFFYSNMCQLSLFSPKQPSKKCLFHLIISRDASPRKTLFWTLYYFIMKCPWEGKEEISLAPRVNWTHDLTSCCSFASEACALPLCYNCCPRHRFLKQRSW